MPDKEPGPSTQDPCQIKEKYYKIHYTSRNSRHTRTSSGPDRSHKILVPVTRIWTPHVTRSQLKSDKITETRTPNMSSTQLESDEVNRNWTLNVKRLQLRSDKVTWIWTFDIKRDFKVVNCIGSLTWRSVDEKWQKNKGECTLTKISATKNP